jgi:hypothetical protein
MLGITRFISHVEHNTTICNQAFSERANFFTIFKFQNRLRDVINKKKVTFLKRKYREKICTLNAWLQMVVYYYPGRLYKRPGSV